MTGKQRKFAQEYVSNGGDASAAYRAAYNTKRMKAETVTNNASKLLRHNHVAAMVAEFQARKVAALDEKFDITVDRVAQELAAIGFANMQDYVSIDQLGNADVNLSKVNRRQFAAISEITIEDIETGQRTGKRTKFKLADKKGALVELGKHLGMFKQQVTHHHELIDVAAEEFDRKLDRLVAEFGGEAQTIN